MEEETQQYIRDFFEGVELYGNRVEVERMYEYGGSVHVILNTQRDIVTLSFPPDWKVPVHPHEGAQVEERKAE